MHVQRHSIVPRVRSLGDGVGAGAVHHLPVVGLVEADKLEDGTALVLGVGDPIEGLQCGC